MSSAINGVKVAFQSILRASSDGCTVGPVSVKTICASLPTCSVVASWGCRFSTSLAGSIATCSVPLSCAANRIAAAIASGLSRASAPLPCTDTGRATAGVTSSSSAACTPAEVALTGVKSTTSRTPVLSSQRALSRFAAARMSLSVCPSRGSMGYALTPPSLPGIDRKPMPPSVGGWLRVAVANWETAWLSASSSVLVATSTWRLTKNEVILVNGSSGWCPARASVAGQSRPSPDVTGSSMAWTSPAVTGTGWVSRGSSSCLNFASASAWLIPPTSTPATTTPRGTSPALEIRSIVYRIAAKAITPPVAISTRPSTRFPWDGAPGETTPPARISVASPSSLSGARRGCWAGLIESESQSGQ